MSAPSHPPVVLVTGASSGIGKATALAYARRGGRLVLLARSAGLLEDVARECRAVGTDMGADLDGGVVAVPGDVLDADAVAHAFTVAAQRFGRLDVVVHSVGVVAYGDLTQVPADLWQRCVDTSVHGTATVARAALAAFGVGAQPAPDATPHGTLAVVGSVLGQVTVPHMSAYVTGKWAVRGLVRCLQQELRGTPGVRVVEVDPGAVDTPIYGLAAAFGGRQGSPPPPVIGAERVAERILQAVDGGPVRRGVGPANLVMRVGFTATPWLYDRLVGPLMRLGGLQRGTVPAHRGNVEVASERVDPPRPDRG